MPFKVVPLLRLDWYITLNASTDGGVETFQLPISITVFANIGVCGGVVINGSGGRRDLISLRISVLAFTNEVGVGVAIGTGSPNANGF